jgi:hypothetical protein
VVVKSYPYSTFLQTLRFGPHGHLWNVYFSYALFVDKSFHVYVHFQNKMSVFGEALVYRVKFGEALGYRVKFGEALVYRVKFGEALGSLMYLLTKTFEYESYNIW